MVPRLFNGERIVFQQMVLRQLEIHMHKNEIGFLPHTIYKHTFNSKCIEDLDVRAKIIKFLEENIREKLHLVWSWGWSEVQEWDLDQGWDWDQELRSESEMWWWWCQGWCGSLRYGGGSEYRERSRNRERLAMMWVRFRDVQDGVGSRYGERLRSRMNVGVWWVLSEIEWMVGMG